MFVDPPSSSGFVPSPTEKMSAQFSEYAELPCRGYNLIFKAKRFGKWHILKGLKPEFRQQTLYQEFLRKEFELGVMLNHPNIVSVISFEQDERLGQCIVMEYVDGIQLSEFLETKPSKKLQAKVLDELLSAMSYYHSLQVVHRDLKPSNILVTRNGNNVKIIDFGLSDADSYVVLKQPAGSLRYAAPEQLQPGMQVDCRADIYALGKILEYHFPYRYRWLAKKCAKANPEKRPDNAANVQTMLHRHALLQRWWWVALLIVVATVGVLLWFRAQTDSVPQNVPDVGEIQEQPPSMPDSSTSIMKNSVEPANTSSALENRLKRKMEEEMYQRFHPLIRDLQNNKYEWRDEAELEFSNTMQIVTQNVPQSVLQNVPKSSKEYESCYFYYNVLYSQYCDTIKLLKKRLPSYEQMYMELTQQCADHKLSGEEYLKKIEELGPDPRSKWTYNLETKLWERKGTN